MIPRVLMFDLDNTLAESKQLLDREMTDLLTKITQQAAFAVMSGAKLEQLTSQVIQQLPPSADLTKVYLLPTCGSALYCYADGVWTRVYEEGLSSEEAERIEILAEQAIESTGIMDLSEESYGERMENRGSQVSFSALGQQAPLEEKRAWDPDNTKKQALRDAIAAVLPEYMVKAGGMTTIDITKQGINKAYGVRQLSDYLQIPVQEMTYVGDALYPGGNDEVVIETGIPTVAVENPEATKRYLASILDT